MIYRIGASALLVGLAFVVPGLAQYGVIPPSIVGTAPRGQIPGVTSNTAATAGNIGEIKTASAAAGSISLSNGTPATIVSLSLEAGAWDVSFVAFYTPASATVNTRFITSISETTNTLDTTMGRYVDWSYNGFTGVTQANAYLTPTVRKNFNSTTSVYGVVDAFFSVDTMAAGGFIRATRVH